jgi:hypothetical protein
VVAQSIDTCDLELSEKAREIDPRINDAYPCDANIFLIFEIKYWGVHDPTNEAKERFGQHQPGDRYKVDGAIEA